MGYGMLLVEMNGVITLSDPLALKYLAPTKRTLVGQSISKVFPKPWADRILTRMQETPSKNFEQTLKIPSENGAAFLNASWETTPEGYWVFLWQEVTEKNKGYIESILAALPDLFFIIDHEGRFLETKPTQINELAFPLEHFMGKYIREVFPTSLAEPMLNSITSCLKGQEVCSLQYQLPIDGVTRDFDARFSPFGTDRVIVLVRDITATKETERSLIKTKNFLEQAGQMALVGAFEYFPATKQLNWSKATRQIHEVPEDFRENLENGLEFFEEGSYREEVIAAMDTAINSGMPVDLETKIRTYTGTQKWVRIKINSEADNGQCVRIYGIVQDVTERKKRLENQQQFIKEAPSAIAMLDTEMRYMAYSKKWLEDYQITDENLLGKSHYEIFPEIGKEWREFHAQSLQGKSFGRDQDRFERADGSVNFMKWRINPWYDGDKIGGIIMLTEDVTKEKLALANQRKLSKIVEESFNEIYLFDRNLTIINANKAAIKNLKYSDAELTNRKLTDLMPDIEIEDFSSRYLKPLLEQEDLSINLETIYQRKDETIYPVKINLKRLVVDDEEYFVAIGLDISERVRHLAAIEEQNRILKEIAWMQSHVMRAPLSRMMMLLSLLENKDIVYEENDLLKSREEVIASVQETAQEIDRIITDISQKTIILDPSFEQATPVKTPKHRAESLETALWIIDQDELSQLVNRYAVIQQDISERPRQFHDSEVAWQTLLSENQSGKSLLVLLDLDTHSQGKTDWFKALKSIQIHADLTVITMNESGEKGAESKWKGHPFILSHVSKPLKKKQIAHIQAIMDKKRDIT
ncbi:PAS domain-containing protein [Lunatimonas salinarum]|uniref:PAS domain-containing protein n=1 Tax=Lunatimonas salinarum TaxID=1774590 RepID=UPI001ADFA73A|nr:PAS domain-containing protein [Lunatimonas salinarum]